MESKREKYTSEIISEIMQSDYLFNRLIDYGKHCRTNELRPIYEDFIHQNKLSLTKNRIPFIHPVLNLARLQSWIEFVVNADIICPACGKSIDFCESHTIKDDLVGYGVLQNHDDGKHEGCHPLSECRFA